MRNVEMKKGQQNLPYRCPKAAPCRKAYEDCWYYWVYFFGFLKNVFAIVPILNPKKLAISIKKDSVK